jgi:hypothetical protein
MTIDECGEVGPRRIFMPPYGWPTCFGILLAMTAAAWPLDIAGHS